MGGYGLFRLGWNEHKARTKWVEGVEKKALDILRNQELEKQKLTIQPLYGIFAENSGDPEDVVFTRKGAEKFLDKINEIIKKVNSL